jgi:hypothetical protein
MITKWLANSPPPSLFCGKYNDMAAAAHVPDGGVAARGRSHVSVHVASRQDVWHSADGRTKMNLSSRGLVIYHRGKGKGKWQMGKVATDASKTGLYSR